MKRVVNMCFRLSPTAVQHIDVLKVFEKNQKIGKILQKMAEFCPKTPYMSSFSPMPIVNYIKSYVDI